MFILAIPAGSKNNRVYHRNSSCVYLCTCAAKFHRNELTAYFAKQVKLVSYIWLCAFYLNTMSNFNKKKKEIPPKHTPEQNKFPNNLHSLQLIYNLYSDN